MRFLKEITDIKEIQQILFGALLHFKKICTKYGLRYFISNGTLIGAAKYNDFVPWDDDADIMMPRADYEKLLSLDEINNEKYLLVSKNTVPEWRMPYAKLTDLRTRLKEGDYEFGFDLGVSVDVLPVDNWHPVKPIARFQALRCDLYKRMLICDNAPCFDTKKTGVKRFLLSVIYKRGKAMGFSKARAKLEKIAFKNSSRRAKYSGCVVWAGHGAKEILPAEVFSDSCILVLRGEEFSAPIGYEAYLDSLYGAWREELPEEKRVSNHNVKAWWKNE